MKEAIIKFQPLIDVGVNSLIENLFFIRTDEKINRIIIEEYMKFKKFMFNFFL